METCFDANIQVVHRKNSEMEKVNLISISLSIGSYSNFVNTIISSAKEKKPYYTCIANVHMLVEAYRNKSFANVISNANIITPDGRPLAWALRLLYGIRQDRVAGMDLLPDLLSAASTENLSVYFYGGTEEILDRTKSFVKIRYPNLKVVGTYSPPFRLPTKDEEDAVIQKIENSKASLVFVVLGCPKQERWMGAVHERLNAVLVGIGGALPVVIGVHKRAPKWMQTAGLEWLFRLIQEPRRLFKRYAITNTWFLFLLLREYYRSRFYKL
ncbi:MAG: glycosyl transferase, WecB/TagA/CpsF family [Segetibacter sp.]|nr:glycosyl transferase, WecB/TagA/CpsF family [Segetibacter sp.]